MMKENWLDKIGRQLEGVKLSEKSLDNMKTLEWFVEGGKARVLSCIIKFNKQGIRYSQLLKMSKLPNTSLNRVLTELQKHEIIIQENVRVKEPRDETVPMYYYNKKKFGSLISYMFDNIIAISRDQIQPIKEKMIDL